MNPIKYQILRNWNSLEGWVAEDSAPHHTRPISQFYLGVRRELLNVVNHNLKYYVEVEIEAAFDLV